jgi:competence ComEA-like helix-hairpin-helix protein
MSREPRAVLFLLGLAVLGHAARLVLGRPRDPPGQLLATAPSANPERHRARAERLALPLRPGEKVDLNTADAEEIARLPRIGMSLAKRIVKDRSSWGPFRGLDELDRVPGVGPALLAQLSDLVSFGGTWVAEAPAENGANTRTLGAYAAPHPALPEGPVDLNSASLADLVALPGIGKARARAILAYRRSHGSFAAVSDLGRVPGFSQSLVGRIAPYLTVR